MSSRMTGTKTIHATLWLRFGQISALKLGYDWMLRKQKKTVNMKQDLSMTL